MNISEQKRSAYKEPLPFLDAARTFYSHPDAPVIVYQQAKEVLGLLKETEGERLIGAALLGFPSYIGYEPLTEPPAEIMRHIDSFAQKIPKNYTHPCPECPTFGKVEDMKTVCRGCQISRFKPREVLKVIPDIDILLVHKEPTPETHLTMSRSLTEKGYVPPAYDFFDSMPRIGQACASPSVGNHLPMDLHIAGIGELQRWSNNFDPRESSTYTIHTNSWRGIGFNDTTIKPNPLIFDPMTISTMSWLNMDMPTSSCVKKINEKCLDWLTERGATDLQEATYAMYSFITTDSQHAGYFQRLTNQDIYKQRLMMRIRENFAQK
jgi:hypothetical protein